MVKMMRWLAAALWVAVLVGCSSSTTNTGGVELTEAALANQGSRTFQAPREQVFEACVAALEAQGYEVVFQEPEKGIVKTGQKLVRIVTNTDGYRYGLVEERSQSTSQQATRQYTLEVGPSRPEGVTVRATPKVFIGSRDVSAEAIWDMDGPAGEPVLWDQLFAEIGSML